MQNYNLFMGETIPIFFIEKQWGLEYQTHADLEWVKIVRMINGSEFQWQLKTGQPSHYKWSPY